MLTPAEHYNTAQALTDEADQARAAGRLAQAGGLIQLANLHANMALAGSLIAQEVDRAA